MLALEGYSALTLGAGGSLIASAFFAAGAVPAIIGRIPSQRMRDALLGFAAGVMLTASFFSLIVPALEATERLYGGGVLPAIVAVIGIAAGMFAVAGLNHVLPHEHFYKGREGPHTPSLRRIWLFIIAVAIHNFPEGLAVGVGFGSGGSSNGLAITTGISLQNIPEGLAIAVVLLGEGYTKARAFVITLLTGLVTAVGGVVGAGAVTLAEPALPWALAFAAGAMLYVISHEIIPETHRRGHERTATTGLGIGLLVMLFLDVWLG